MAKPRRAHQTERVILFCAATGIDHAAARGQELAKRSGIRSTNVPVGRARNGGVGCPQRRRPALAQIVEIGLARLDAVVDLGVADIAAGDENVEREADAEIRSHSGIDRNQTDLQRVVEVDVVGAGAVEAGWSRSKRHWRKPCRRPRSMVGTVRFTCRRRLDKAARWCVSLCYRADEPWGGAGTRVRGDQAVAPVDSLKALDPEWPIREADIS
jgi:hypothetical protein